MKKNLVLPAQELALSFAFGFLLAVAFDPFTYTGATTLRWALLAACLPLLCLRISSRNHFTFSHLAGLAFIAWAAISLKWTAGAWDGYGALIQMAIVSTAFVYGNRVSSLDGIFAGLAAGMTISSAILLAHPILTFPSIVETYPHGLFGNRNMLGECAVLVALGCLVYKRYWFIPGLLPAIFWPPIPRGALCALAIGIIFALWSRTKWAIPVAVGVIAVVAFHFLSIQGWRLETISERLEIWHAVGSDITLLGHGLGSLFTLAPYLSDHWDTAQFRLDHAHNDALEIMFELGIPGLVLYTSIITHAIGCQIKDGPLGNTLPVLVGGLVISNVAFPWHIPANAFILAVVLGHAIRNGAGIRDMYDGWIALLRGGQERHRPALAISDRQFAASGKI